MRTTEARPVIVALAVTAGLALVLPEDFRALVESMRNVIFGPDDDAESERRTGRLLWSVALVGVILRTRALLVQRALWLDEAYLARSVLDRNLMELISTPLANNQSAPPGFLALVHAAVTLIGFDELSLRIIPFLASIATLVVSVHLAQRAFRTRIGAVAFIALISLSPFLIYYSQEFKQYAFDSLAATLVLLIHATAPQRRHPWAVGLALGIMAVVSLPGAVVVAIAVGVDVVRAESWHSARRRLVTAGVAGSGVLLHLAYTVRAGTDRQIMVAYWQGHSFPPDADVFVQLRWYFAKALEIAWTSLAHGSIGTTSVAVGQPWVIYGFVGVAVFSLRRRTGAVDLAWMLLVATVLLAQATIYPIGTRLSLHLVPVLSLLFAAGLETLHARSHLRPVLAVVFGLVLLLPLTESWDRLKEPRDRHDIRAAVAVLNAQAQPSDVIIMNAFSRHAFELYVDSGLIEPRFSVRWTRDARGSAESVTEILDGYDFVPVGTSDIPRRAWFVAWHRDAELQEAARVASVDHGLSPACEARAAGLLVALYTNVPSGLDSSACEWRR